MSQSMWVEEAGRVMTYSEFNRWMWMREQTFEYTLPFIYCDCFMSGRMNCFVHGEEYTKKYGK